MAGGLQQVTATTTGRPPEIQEKLTVRIELSGDTAHQAGIGSRIEAFERGVIVQSHSQRQLRWRSTHAVSSSRLSCCSASYNELLTLRSLRSRKRTMITAAARSPSSTPVKPNRSEEH